MSSRKPLWFCHECNAEMRPLMVPDPVCASCHGCFIEKMENGKDDPRQFAREDDEIEGDKHGRPLFDFRPSGPPIISLAMPDYNWDDIDHDGLELALQEARKSYQEGGIPIGSILLLPGQKTSTGFMVLGSGHNNRIQKGSPILHGEISALEDAGRQMQETYRNSVLYTTLSPCSMCSGAILLYKIPRVVIGENKTFLGEEELLRSRGVEVVVLNNQECKDLMAQFTAEKPEEWKEDIGELPVRDGSDGKTG